MMERSSVECIGFVSNALPSIRREVEKLGGGQAVLLAATKTVPVDAINYAIDHLGLTDIGENRVQELLDKYDALHKENLRIHFIGRLQTNKVKYIIDKVCLIHSVDSEKLAAEIDRQAEKHGLVMRILVEINLTGEASKGGIEPSSLKEFLEKLSAYRHLFVAGLMAIPPAGASRQENMEYFRQMYRFFIDNFSKKMHNKEKYILSMGMSDSYREALSCGSTLVRLGSALFGKRPDPNRTATSEKN